MNHHRQRHAASSWQHPARHAAHPADARIARVHAIPAVLAIRLPLTAAFMSSLLGALPARRQPHDGDRHPDRHRDRPWDNGSFTAEAVLVTAILVSIALAAIAALGAKVMAKVESIDFG